MNFFNSYNTALNIIRVGYLSKRNVVVIPHNKIILRFVDKLISIRYINFYEYTNDNRSLRVHLLYCKNRLPFFKYTKLWYRQSLRTFISYKKLFLLYKRDYGTVYILSTTHGLLTHTEAIHYQIGGELICVLYS